MYKKLTLILLVLFSILLSCSEIENNSRIAFQLKVVDDANQPIPDIAVNSYAFRETAFIPFIIVLQGFEGILGVSNTDDQGEATLISLEPSQERTQVAVVINTNTSEQFEITPINEEYGVVIYQLDSIVDFNELVILPNTILRRNAVLEFEIIDNPNLDGELAYTITYPTRVQQFQFPEGESFTSNSTNGVGVSDFSGVLTIETLQNTTVIFEYTITSDNGDVMSNTIEIPINQETVQYVFEF